MIQSIRSLSGTAAASATDLLDDRIAELFHGYLDDTDWRVRENANASYSINGLNNYVREAFTQRYWLTAVYPEAIGQAHTQGDLHLHDLGFLGPYCAGWDLRQLLMEGFGGAPGKIESKPARHLRAFLGQVVNATFSTAGECAGAQAWSSIDTYCAPFIRHDQMTDTQLKQCLQEFVFNLNVPTRVGFQCPFSNLTFDLTVPATLRDQAVILGGQIQSTAYGDYQAEMDRFNQAFCEVMFEGDARGRVFTFPIPTINITRQFDWESPAAEAFLKIACKYGIPYFANYVTSDLSPEDAVSMCCRLRLNTRELRKRGGGLFGSNPLTGSIGVCTLNLPRLGFLARSKADFLQRLGELADLGRDSLEIKRQKVEALTNRGLYPYAAHFLRDVHRRTGAYWHNHFSTLGIVGMHEGLLNLLGRGIDTHEGQAFALEVMHLLRERLSRYQEDTGHVYNLEATPAEGAAHRLALLDQKRYPGIRQAGEDPAAPYYTNSTQLPVGYSEDLFEVLELQDELQSLYTGGTVLHLYLGERVEDTAAARGLIRRIFEHHKLPYLSLTPTFSICSHHGYLAGEHPACPHCQRGTEIWSRVTGYLRPLSHFNRGKRQEFADRRLFRLGSETACS